MRSMILMFLLALLAACTDPVDSEGQSSPELADPDNQILQFCRADCLAPTYNGVPISCNATTCSAVVGSITCNGVTSYCQLAPPPPTTCAMFPAMSCTNKRTCDDLCGGPGTGVCNLSTACCFCR